MMREDGARENRACEDGAHENRACEDGGIGRTEHTQPGVCRAFFHESHVPTMHAIALPAASHWCAAPGVDLVCGSEHSMRT